MGHYIWNNGPSLRSRFDRGVGGQRSGQAVPEIPYKKGYWSNYGWQTLVSLAVCQGALITLVTGWEELAMVGGLLYIGFLAIVVVGSASAPLWFWARHRDLAEVFGDVADHKPVQAPTLIKEHPNPTVHVDGSQVVTAGVVLLVLGLADALFGYAVMFRGLAPQPLPVAWQVFGIYLLAEGGALLGLGVFTLTGKHRAAGAAFFLMLAGWGVALPTLALLPIIVRMAAAVLVWRGYQSLREMHDRVVEPEKEDALTVYYHNLLAILVWVMRADGHCDRRERAKLNRLFDSLHLSRYERELVVSAANQGDRPVSIEATVKRYQEAAEALGIAGPDLHLLSAAQIVAAADGVLHPEETTALRDLGGWLELPSDEVDALLEQHEATLAVESMDVERARALLQVAADATLEDARSAYERYAQEFAPDHFLHLGSAIAEHAERRLAAVTRAWELLQAEGVGADDC